MSALLKTPVVLPDFQDTESAFAHLDQRAFLRARRIFRWMNAPVISKIGPPLISLSLKLKLPIKRIVKNTVFDIFCGGTSLENTTERIELLFKNGIRTILDYSVEGEKNLAGFDLTRDEIIKTIEYAAKNEAVEFSALKVSGICNPESMTKKQANEKLKPEDTLNLEQGFNRLEMICKRASELGQSVFIDAEETWFQDVIDRWAEGLMEKYNKEKAIVNTTVQMYRHDRLAYLESLIQSAKSKGFVLGIKVVRGAYLEKENERALKMAYPTPIQKDKISTDKDFDSALELCVLDHARVALCAGTHNEKSSLFLAKTILEKGIDPSHRHVVFSQLLGMSDHISFNLAKAGFNVAKYLPYGPVESVIPYLMRRAAENTSVSGQSSRELELLEREGKRRGL